MLRFSPVHEPGSLYVSILREDPELAQGLSEEDHRAAAALLRAQVILASGQRWNPPLYEPAASYGLLILDGLLGRRVRLGRATALELLGVGDIVRPWDDADLFELVPATSEWRVFSPARLAVLDERITTLIGRRLALTINFSGRLMRQARRATYLMALSHLPRVEDRILAALWHIASTCGRVTPEGTAIPFRITHAMLGEIVGAQRPSVTVAIRALETSGKLTRPEPAKFILCGEPPALESHAEISQAQSA